MIYLSKRGYLPRYIAEQRGNRLLVWWKSPTGKVADLQLIAAREVPRQVRRRIIRARHRTKRAAQ